MLYALWFIFNLPNTFYQRLYKNGLSNPVTWFRFVKNSFLSSTFTASWFMASCIFSAWFVFFLSKKYGMKKTLGISSGLYLLCILSSTYGGLLPAWIKQVLSFFCFPLNIFNGCIYFSLGKLIAENESAVRKRLSGKKCLILFVLCYAVYVSEVLLAIRLSILSSNDIAFGTAPMAFFMFIWLLQSNVTVKSHLLLRKLSIIIYLCQANVVFLNRFCTRFLHMHSLIGFLISAAATAAICALVFYIQAKDRWKWAKFLT